jgi:hypothetical protein
MNGGKDMGGTAIDVLMVYSRNKNDLQELNGLAALQTSSMMGLKPSFSEICTARRMKNRCHTKLNPSCNKYTGQLITAAFSSRRVLPFNQEAGFQLPTTESM